MYIIPYVICVNFPDSVRIRRTLVYIINISVKINLYNKIFVDSAGFFFFLFRII